MSPAESEISTGHSGGFQTVLVRFNFLEIGARVVDRKPPSNCPQLSILASGEQSSPNNGCRPDDCQRNPFCLKELSLAGPVGRTGFSPQSDPCVQPAAADRPCSLVDMPTGRGKEDLPQSATAHRITVLDYLRYTDQQFAIYSRLTEPSGR